MIVSLTLALTPVAAAPALSATPLPPAPLYAFAQEGHEEQIAAAGEDVDKLLELAAAWKEAGEDDAARAAWRRVLELDEANRDAHEGLRHHEYDGQWFETYTALAKYRREEEKRMAEQGLVRFRDEWVPKEQVRYLKLGWEQDSGGDWVSPTEQAFATMAEERRAEGWTLHGLTWVSPDEAAKVEQGLFKCGDEWLDGAAADEFHADLGSWWEIPGEHFAIYTTLPRNNENQNAEWARWWADSTYAPLVKIFGVKPGDRPTLVELRGPSRTLPPVVVLRSVEQYNSFAAGSQEEQRQAAEQEGFSSLHYAFFADSYIAPPPTQELPPLYRGAGVAMYAFEDPNLEPYAQYAVRHAAAQSYVEAIDPSWDTLGDAFAGQGGLSAAAFWEEKQIPRWLRYGAASFVERYMIDPNAGEGGDPMWIRKWGMQNLSGKGGVGDLEQVFAFELSLEDIPNSTQLIHRAGAVVAFLVDGGDAEVREAHGAFKQALRAGDGAEEAVAALEAVLASKAAEIEAFCQQN